MLFNSTRNNTLKVSSAQAIKQGLSNEGGLFVPEFFPQVSLEEINSLVNKKYVDIAKFVLSKYLTDFTEEELELCINSAYTKEKFGSDKIAPLYKLNNDTFFIELWHGPTCAFKDMALQILPYLLTVSAKKTGEDKLITILVATSGDTGKAALEGFKDVDGTKIIVFYPKDGVSDIQKLQMVTQAGENVFVSGVDGNFDDAQNGVKKLFTDEDFKKELFDSNIVFSSANSINFGRLVPQVVYYFSSYIQLLENGMVSLGDKINVVVPTGNFGNILAAYYAKMMGLPIDKLICASNSNNVLTDFINTGVYDKNRAFNLTSSPSMDILISSNLERLLYELSDKDDKLITEYMSQLQSSGKYKVSDAILNKVKTNFYGGYCDDTTTAKVIKETFESYGYLIDTHTAVAKAVYDKYVEETGDKKISVIASTASPYKFLNSVITAVDETYDTDKDDFTKLQDLSEKSNTSVPDALGGLKGKSVRFSGVCEKEQMKDIVKTALDM
ncbi:MAG: threonine synthase [Ruminococcaceae bacterium]|nr:threonine synthase [Oscillospiraceae bacterium]